MNEYPLNNMIQKLLSGYTGATQARYLQPTLEEELQKAKLYNQYYAPDIQSQIGLRNAQRENYDITNLNLPAKLKAELALTQAQTGETGARTGLIGEQTRGQHITNQWLPQKLQSLVALHNANARQAQLVQDAYNLMLRGGVGQLPGNTPPPGIKLTGRPEMSLDLPAMGGQGGMIPGQPQGQGQGQGQGIPSTAGQPQQQPKFNYPQAAAIMNLLKMGQPKPQDINGKYIAITPLGNIDTGVRGLDANQKAFQQGLGKYGAKIYGDAVDSYKAYQNQGAALDDLIYEVNNNPEFRNVTGPINKPITSWIGSAEKRELLGKLQSSSGEIALQVAPALKGSFTGRDQNLINEIKASPRDFPDIFIGKLKAQSLINNVLSERSRLLSQYIEQGFTPTQAIQLATRETPIDKYRPMINQLIKPKKTVLQEASQSDLEYTAKKYNMTVDEVKKKLESQ